MKLVVKLRKWLLGLFLLVLAGCAASPAGNKQGWAWWENETQEISQPVYRYATTLRDSNRVYYIRVFVDSIITRDSIQ